MKKIMWEEPKQELLNLLTLNVITTSPDVDGEKDNTDGGDTEGIF